MHRLSPADKIARTRLARERERRRVRRRMGRGARRRGLQDAIIEHWGHRPVGAPHRNRVPIMVPKVLSLRENYVETVKFINDIRHQALTEYRPVDLFFSDLESIEPAALTVLTAEIFRCRKLRRIGGRPAVSGYYPSNPEIYRQLREIGFFRLLEIVDRHPPEVDRNARPSRFVLPFLTDAIVTPERSAEFIDGLAELIGDAVPMDDRSKRYLQGAIIEAMKNAGEHAYKLRTPHQPLGHRWWLTGAFDSDAREAFILLFDQGIGIPATLEPELRDKVESVASLEGFQPRDSLMIEVATRPGNTSTGQSGRGKGFKTMRKFIDDCDDGELFVYSDRGHYVYARGGTARGDQPLSLGGTLIQWRFKHSETLAVIVP